MLILIEDTERGLDVARGIWGAFSSCLYVEAEDIDYTQLINKCEQCNVSLVLITESVEYFKEKNPHAFCFYCDGGDMEKENDKTVVFVKEDKRDNIVTLIIAHLKRKKLL